MIWLVGWGAQLLVVLLLAQAVLGLFSRNLTAAALRPVLEVLVRPLVQPIRQRMRPVGRGGLDFSPIVVFIALQIVLGLQGLAEHLVHQALFGG